MIRWTTRVHLTVLELTIAIEIPGNQSVDYTQFTQNTSFHGLRLGVPRTIFFNESYYENPEIIEVANDAIRKMKSLGAHIQYPADLPSADELPSGKLGVEAIIMRMCLLIGLTKAPISKSILNPDFFQINVVRRSSSYRYTLVIRSLYLHLGRAILMGRCIDMRDLKQFG
jgi:hypothetical protein